MRDDGLMRRVLENARRIAVVGASDKPERDSHRIFAYLRAAGYDVVPVNPAVREVAGVPAVAGLAEAGAPDLVNVFRAPEHLPGVVDEAIACGARAIWTQYGVVHDEALARARAAGLDVVADECIMVEHRRLLGPG
mgnify:CR=1 FL=1